MPSQEIWNSVGLSMFSANIVVGTTGEDAPAVIHGVTLDSPVGPSIIVGVNIRQDGHSKPECFSAYLSTDEAMFLAARLLEHVALVAELGGGKIQ
jgi:hypothetical protein